MVEFSFSFKVQKKYFLFHLCIITKSGIIYIYKNFLRKEDDYDETHKTKNDCMLR